MAGTRAASVPPRRIRGSARLRRADAGLDTRRGVPRHSFLLVACFRSTPPFSSGSRSMYWYEAGGVRMNSLASTRAVAGALTVVLAACIGPSGCGGKLAMWRSAGGGEGGDLDGGAIDTETVDGGQDADGVPEYTCRPMGEACSTGGDCCTGICPQAPGSTCACSLYGQLCTSDTNCCYGVPCSYSGAPCPPGQSGCRCTYAYGEGH